MYSIALGIKIWKPICGRYISRKIYITKIYLVENIDKSTNTKEGYALYYMPTNSIKT